MPDRPVSTKVDVCRGHDACEPRDFQTWSPDVTAEGIEVVRQTDTLRPHGCDDHKPHTAKVLRGHPRVTANGLPIGYVTAKVACPSREINTGRASVVVGDPYAAEPDRVGADGRARRNYSTKPYDCRGRQLFQQQTMDTCAMAAVRAMVAQMTGNDYPEQQIVDIAKGLETYWPGNPEAEYSRVYEPFVGTTASGLPGVLKPLGVDSHQVSVPANPSQIDAGFVNEVTNGGTTPALFSVRYPGTNGHAVLVDGIDDDGRVLIRDPWPSGPEGCTAWPLSKLQKSAIPRSEIIAIGEAPADSPPKFGTRPYTPPTNKPGKP